MLPEGCHTLGHAESNTRNPCKRLSNAIRFLIAGNGTPESVSELGFTPGKKASSVRAFDSVEGRKGYSGLYQFGAAYNPGKFKAPISSTARSGNYLLYWMASQALWRADPLRAKGLDATVAYDWSTADVNRNNRILTVGLRFNEPLPIRDTET
jgi:porin